MINEIRMYVQLKFRIGISGCVVRIQRENIALLPSSRCPPSYWPAVGRGNGGCVSMYTDNGFPMCVQGGGYALNNSSVIY